jgi:hypothetical protein
MPRIHTIPDSGALIAFCCSALLLTITSFLPFYFKTWFVEAGGNIKIAPFLGAVFAFGLLFRRNWAYKGALVLAGILFLVFIASILTTSEKPGFWIALVLDTLLLFLLFTPQVKQYCCSGLDLFKSLS